MLSSITRLRVRSIRFLPAFLWHAFQIQRQVERAAGFVGGRLLIDRKLTFWTLTVWENEKTMKQFRGTGAHVRVMSRLGNWCDEAAYAHWSQLGDAIPQWDESYEHLVKEGQLSRVEHSSKSHLDREFPRPRLSPLIGREMKAATSANFQRP